MEWIPSWLAEGYAKLYLHKRAEIFEFAEAKRILRARDSKTASKILKPLRDRGFLISRRDPVDARKRILKLVDPESIVFAFGVQSEAKSKSVEEKLRVALAYLDYVIAGAYAAYQHHGYTAPEKIDVYIRNPDLHKWIALLKEEQNALSIDQMPSEKDAGEHIHLHSSLTEDLLERSELMDGVRYLSLESLIVRGLKEQEEVGLIDVLAMLVVKEGDLNWKGLLRSADDEHVLRELGFSLEILSFEAMRELFSRERIAEILKRANLSRVKIFPEKIAENSSPAAVGFPTERSESYPKIAEKWNMKSYVPRALVSKIVTDLVR